MAKEPNGLVLRLLRDIRATQETQGATLQDQSATLEDVKNRVEDLYKISTHTLGVAANAPVRYQELETRVDNLTQRVERLEAKQ
jgi:polyhydroxyalkanoate synthesis regulator phasin